jgi:hypothetical protein
LPPEVEKRERVIGVKVGVMMRALRGIIGRQEIRVTGVLYQVFFARQEIGAKRLGQIPNGGSIDQLVPALAPGQSGHGQVGKSQEQHHRDLQPPATPQPAFSAELCPMMPFPSLWQPVYLLPFGVALSLCLSFLAYSWHIFRPLLGAFWVRFLGTFVDSKGLVRFVPLILTSFMNFLRVFGTFGAALLKHSVAAIAITLTSRGSSLMKISPTSLASRGR